MYVRCWCFGMCDLLSRSRAQSEAVFTSKTRVMADKHTKLPAQAVDAHLSFIEVPSLEHDYGVEAAEYLSSLVKAPRLQANVDYRIGNTLYLTVFNPKAPKDYAASVNADLLRAGYAQVAKKIAKKFEGRAGDLKKYQDAARAQRKGMFEYGDFALGEEL